MDDRKEDIIHDDVASLNDKSKIPGDAVPLVTQDKYLTLWQTIRTYPRASALSAAAAFGAVSDGYQFNLPGVSDLSAFLLTVWERLGASADRQKNIIALPGFVQTFGSQGSNGKWAINPQHVSLWSGELLRRSPPTTFSRF